MGNTNCKTVRLSKSQIVDGMLCPNKAYLSIHQRNLKTTVSPSMRSKFETGTKIGKMARDIFPNGHLVDFPPHQIDAVQADTQRAIDDGCNTIYEAAFGNDEYHFVADIMHRESSDQDWDIYEVKSGTSAKDEYVLDVAVQCWIMDQLGVKWNKAHVVFVNNKCCHPDLSNLFIIEDVTSLVRNFIDESLAQDIKNLAAIVGAPNPPKCNIGRKCEQPYACGFKAHCWKNNPEFTSLDLPRGWSLFDKGKFEIDGINESDLTKSQKLPFKAIVEDFFYVNKAGIENAVADWDFPIYHLDFETINPAIPRYDGTSPYQQIPFQFSLQIQHDLIADPDSYDYLHPDTSDPRRALAEKLCEWIPEDATIIMAYSASFENRVLTTLASMFPDLSERLLAMASKLVDLLPAVKTNVYHKAFRGSYSVKAVAPALLGEEWGYKNLEVQDGLIAQVVFDQMTDSETNPERAEELYEQLIQYCARDTLVLTELVKWFFSKAEAVTD